MLKRKTYFKAIFVLPLLLQIFLLSINFQSNFDLNNPNYSIMNHDITTICQMGKFDIDTNEKNTVKLIESKEISVIPEFENIFCLGKVVEVFENDKEIFSISSYSECNDIKLSSNLKNNLNFFKSPLCRVWGWATWNDRWEKHLFISNKYISKNPISCFFSLPYKFRTST